MSSDCHLPNFACLQDLGLAQAAAESCGAQIPHGSLARQIYGEMSGNVRSAPRATMPTLRPLLLLFSLFVSHSLARALSPPTHVPRALSSSFVLGFMPWHCMSHVHLSSHGRACVGAWDQAGTKPKPRVVDLLRLACSCRGTKTKISRPHTSTFKRLIVIPPSTRSKGGCRWAAEGRVSHTGMRWTPAANALGGHPCETMACMGL